MITESIVSKKNGVNPFLAVMNFKITVKTWIKHARIRLKQKRLKEKLEENGQNVEGLTSLNDEEDTSQAKIGVEIEKEENFDFTTDDDDEDDVNGQSGMKNKDGLSGIGSMNNLGLSSKKSSRKKDYLKHFEKKMSQKFRLNES